ncbi:hypothetical protein [Vibrio sp. F74]|uniref:hypothetical protein n=1 Tax=Vibrio sp. F74 TaxID=700020 RepID=UPI0035F571E9
MSDNFILFTSPQARKTELSKFVIDMHMTPQTAQYVLLRLIMGKTEIYIALISSRRQARTSQNALSTMDEIPIDACCVASIFLSL